MASRKDSELKYDFIIAILSISLYVVVIRTYDLNIFIQAIFYLVMLYSVGNFFGSLVFEIHQWFEWKKQIKQEIFEMTETD